VAENGGNEETPPSTIIKKNSFLLPHHLYSKVINYFFVGKYVSTGFSMEVACNSG
jgi:hypothetical protein